MIQKRVAAVAALALGCAAPPRTPADLPAARAALEEARRSPFAAEAREALLDASASLARAERDQRREPGSPEAFDSAYVALRDAERARVSGLYAAERAALAAQRAAVSRREQEIVERDARAREQARQLDAHRRAREARDAARREALARANTGGSIERDPAGTRLRISADAVFWPGSAVVRVDSYASLGAIAAALRAGPPCSVTIEVLDDAEGYGLDPRALAHRRKIRLVEALTARGVRADVFEPSTRRPPRGVELDIVITEQAIDGAPIAP